jgi:lipoprotein-releasing system ATP-binding protein
MSESSVLHAVGLNHVFGAVDQVKQSVLSGASLTIAPGDTLAILGKSGSGKTTLLHFLAGLALPDAGDVFLLGASYRAMSSQKLAWVRNRHLGFVYQHHFLLQGFNVLENVAMPLLIRGLPHKQAFLKAEHAVESVALSQRMYAPVAQLSGGERQRVSVARAIVGSPKLLIADEPTGSLDHQHASDLMDLLLDLSKAEGLALLMATHDTRAAQRVGRAYHLQEGVLVSL